MAEAWPHCRQAENWDCGLACAVTVLRGLGAPESLTLDSLHLLCPLTSIWTVDLAFLLRRCGLRVTFCTLTLGANPGYASESFYEKALAEDVDRVNLLFQQTQEAGILVQQRSVSLEEVRLAVSAPGQAVILLIDKRHLDAWPGVGYQGHYVVLCGYDEAQGAFLVRDPASSTPLRLVEGARLQEARTAFGTDEDILFVSGAWREE